MKRTIIFSVLLMFLFGAMAYATETRVMTMGEANNIVMDEANISLYPSVINYYPSLFIGEFSDYDYYKIGGHFQFAQESNPFVIGAYFSQDDYDHDIFFEGGTKTRVSADHRIDLFYGRNLGEIPFGFAFGYYSEGEKDEDDDVTSNYDQSLTRFEFMLGISPMEKKLDIAGGIALTSWNDEDYRFWSATDSGFVKISEPAGNMDLMLNARYWMDPMGNYVLIPHASFLYSKQGVDWYDDDVDDNWVVDETYESTDMMFTLGLGMNYEADEDVLVVGDFGVAVDNYKLEYTDPQDADNNWEYKDKLFVLPHFKIGIDAKVFKWLDLRSGVWTRWERQTDETEGTKDVESDSRVDTYLGAGFNWGRFYIDAEVHTDFLEHGPYFISGESTDYLFERVSVKYMF